MNGSDDPVVPDDPAVASAPSTLEVAPSPAVELNVVLDVFPATVTPLTVVELEVLDEEPGMVVEVLPPVLVVVLGAVVVVLVGATVVVVVPQAETVVEPWKLWGPCNVHVASTSTVAV